MERLKEQARQEFTHQAASWRKWKSQQEAQGRAATQTLLRAARVKPGMQVLDLASGAGDPALTLAEVVGPDGHVTATDLVPDMLAAAEEFARQRGLTNITFRQADAEALPFPDQAFDVVTCRLGVMFFPNVGKALAEMRRVLKPGGRAAFVAWGPSEQMLHTRIPQDILKKYVQVPAPGPGPRNPDRFRQAGTLSAALRDADFRQVQEDSPTVPYPWPGPPEQYWEHRQQDGPIPRLLERLAPEQREQVDAEVIEAVRPYYDGQQVNFTATIVVASGVR
jgi:ubiquinone/menaquinone biosynthesis C-methylase UbiE